MTEQQEQLYNDLVKSIEVSDETATAIRAAMESATAIKTDEQIAAEALREQFAENQKQMQKMQEELDNTKKMNFKLTMQNSTGPKETFDSALLKMMRRRKPKDDTGRD